MMMLVAKKKNLESDTAGRGHSHTLLENVQQGNLSSVKCKECIGRFIYKFLTCSFPLVGLAFSVEW